MLAPSRHRDWGVRPSEQDLAVEDRGSCGSIGKIVVETRFGPVAQPELSVEQGSINAAANRERPIYLVIPTDHARAQDIGRGNERETCVGCVAAATQQHKREAYPE